jgi:hypothetical protein
MMTRKHFKKIASIIQKFPYAKGALAKEFGDMCQEENPRFDRETFIKACGIGIVEE